MVHVLKSDEVKFEGQIQLDAQQTEGNMPTNKNINNQKQQVHIVENNPEFAVIEVICCCGVKTYLRCEYIHTETHNKNTESSQQ